MRTWVTILLIVFLIPSLLPATAAQEEALGIQNQTEAAETTMYIHMGVPHDYPINTQLPADTYGVSEARGLATMTNTCVPDQVPGLVRADRHTWYSYSSPGYVHYDVDQGGKPRVHPERGLSYDINFDTDAPIRFVWYMESQVLSNDLGVNGAPSVTPNVVVQATFREGDDISVNHEALNTGRIIAQARTDAALLAGPATPDHPQVTYMPITQDGETKHVYEFAMEVPFEDPARRPQILHDESYNLRVDLFIENPACSDPGDEEKLMPNTVRLHSSDNHRPRFTWDVEEAIVIESLHPQFIGDELVIHTSANSPWGNYDVRGDQPTEFGSYSVEITGPSTPVNLQLAAMNAQTFNHDHHTEAVSAAHVWSYKEELARPGIYTVTFRVSNDQETASSVATAQFEVGEASKPGCTTGADGLHTCSIEKPTQKSTPGPAIGAIAVALAGLSQAMRRRQ